MGVVIVCAVIAWKVAERVINVDQYRPWVVARLEESTGLPASIEQLDLDLFPTPRVQALQVRLGEGNFEAAAASVAIQARLGGLLRGRIEIDEVRFEELEVTVPRDKDSALEQWKTVQEHLGSRPSDTDQARVSLARVRARGTRLFLGDNPTPLVSGDVEVRDVLGQDVTFVLDGISPALAETAQIHVEGTIQRRPDGLGIEAFVGNAHLSGLDLGGLFPAPYAEDLRITLDAAINGKLPADIAADLQGFATARAGARPFARTIAGPFTAKAWWRDGAVVVNDFVWEAPGLTFTADAGYSAEGELACEIPQLAMTEAALQQLVADASSGQFRLIPRERAAVRVSNLVWGRPADGALRLVSGEVFLEGLDLGLADGRTLLDNLHGRVQVDENTFSIAELAADGFSLAGLVRPDLSTGAVTLDLDGESAQFGNFQCEGRYKIDHRTWEGLVSGDVERIAKILPTTEPRPEWAGPLLAAYGPSVFAVSLRLPTPSSPAGTIHISRRGAPSAEGVIGFEPQADGWRLGAVEASASIPMDALRQALPAGVEAMGQAPLTFTRSVEDEQFHADLDLTACSMTAGKFLEKKPGHRATVTIEGDATASALTPRAATLTCLGETVHGSFKDEEIAVDALDISLAPLAALLPKGASAGGRVTGKIATAPYGADLQLHNVQLALTPELAIGSITGDLAYANGLWTCRRVRLQGANSDCTVTGSWRGTTWEGRLEGKQLDLNAFNVLVGEAQAFRGEGDQTAAAGKRPFRGELSVALDSLLFQRAKLDAARADVLVSEEGVHLKNISGQPYAGTVTGSIEARDTVAEGATVYNVDLTLDGVDARFADDLLFPEPRELSGAISGKVALAIPVKEGVPPINGASGRIVLVGEQGSLGKLGLATKLIAILRTAEMVWLRLPSLKDEGLTYDSFSATLTMKNGLLTVHEFNLKSPSLGMEARGTVNFPEDATDLEVWAHPLEVVTGLVERVPVLGEAVGEVRKRSGVTLRVKGAPSAPTITVVSTPAIQEIKDAAKAGEELVKEELRDWAVDIIGNILGR